jgi:O-antigen ligase
MPNNDHKNSSSRLALWSGVASVGVGIVAGFLAGIQPLVLGLAVVAVVAVIYFFTSLEQAALGGLILRSAIDTFTSPPLPSAFAIGIDAMTLIYITVLLLTSKTVRTDWFWWFFASWVVLQGMWVILLPLGALGMDASFLSDSIREWVRLFSWLMVYLLMMQLKNKLPPEKVISILFWSLVIPIAVALMQMFLPSLLPAALSPTGGESLGALPEGSRIRGTIGHSNGFATYLFLFLGLTWWKVGQSKQRLPWLILLGFLVFLYMNTKALFSLMMLAVFVLVLVAPRLSLIRLIAAILLLGTLLLIFASTDFGQQRLGSISNTPLLNPDIDVWRAILLSKGDNNSFNWRIAQWTYLLQEWQYYPIFGYGLGVSTHLSTNNLPPHNDYVRALVEGGVVGLIAFLVFFATQVVRLLQLSRQALPGSAQRNLCLVLLAILLSLPVGMITENIWSHTMLFFYWWTIFGVAGWDWNELPPSKSYVSLQER